MDQSLRKSVALVDVDPDQLWSGAAPLYVPHLLPGTKAPNRNGARLRVHGMVLALSRTEAPMLDELARIVEAYMPGGTSRFYRSDRDTLLPSHPDALLYRALQCAVESDGSDCVQGTSVWIDAVTVACVSVAGACSYKAGKICTGWLHMATMVDDDVATVRLEVQGAQLEYPDPSASVAWKRLSPTTVVAVFACNGGMDRVALFTRGAAPVAARLPGARLLAPARRFLFGDRLPGSGRVPLYRLALHKDAVCAAVCPCGVNESFRWDYGCALFD